MSNHGKAPLDNRSETSEDGRSERFADIERRSGDKIGAKEMALTKKPRDEDESKRAEKFVEIERRSDD